MTDHASHGQAVATILTELRKDFMIAKRDIKWLTIRTDMEYEKGGVFLTFGVHMKVYRETGEVKETASATAGAVSTKPVMKESDMVHISGCRDLGHALEEAYHRASFNLTTGCKS